MAAKKFAGDDNAYLEWIKKCPDGYVINAYRDPKEKKVKRRGQYS